MKRWLLVIGWLLMSSRLLEAQEATITGSVVPDPARPGMYIAEWSLPPATTRWIFQRCHDQETWCEVLAAGARETRARAELYHPRPGSSYIVTAFRGTSFVEAKIGVSASYWAQLPYVQH